MKSYQLDFVRRFAARGRYGEDLALVNGNEPDEKLQGMILDLSKECPVSHGHVHCPFYLLSGMADDARAHLIKSLSRQACLEMFDAELACRVSHRQECFSKIYPSPLDLIFHPESPPPAA